MYYLIIVVYTMMPLPMMLAAIFACTMTVVQLLIGGLMANAVTDYMELQV